MQKTVFALDLDLTLASSLWGGREYIYTVLADFGCDPVWAAQLFESIVWDTEGFSFERYIDILVTSRPDLVAHKSAILLRLNTQLQSGFCFFDDVVPMLDTWRLRGDRIFIITAGNQAFQRQKIAILGYPFDEVFIVSPTAGKASIVQMLLDRYPESRIVFIDDKIKELDRVASALDSPRLSLFRIVRNERISQPGAYPQIATLTELHL